jgi:hypothetical protein
MSFGLAESKSQRQSADSPDRRREQSKSDQPIGAAKAPPTKRKGGLLQQADLEYVGAFRVPSQAAGASSLNFGGTAIAYNAANKSLFVVGHDHQQCVGEISIPEIRKGAIDALAVCEIKQPFVDVLAKVPKNPLAGKGAKIGGLLVVGDQLIGSAYIYYDAAHSGILSHFTLSTHNLETAQVTGLFKVGNLGGGYVGGPMCAIPPAWHRRLGAAYITGLCSVPVVGRTSAGPGAAFGFDPAQLGPQAAPAIGYCYHPHAEMAFGDGDDNDPKHHRIWNWTAYVQGVVFPEGTDTVLFFGRIGVGPFRYDGGSNAEPYVYRAWAYDANDFEKAKNGQLKPWRVRPYGVWDLDLPYANDPNWYNGTWIGGAAYDPSVARIYASAMKQDGESSLPVIHVYQVR